MTQREVGLRRPDSAVRTRSNKSPRLRTGAGNFYAVAVNGVLPIPCSALVMFDRAISGEHGGARNPYPPSTSSYCQSLTLAGGLRRSRLPSCHRGATLPSGTMETRPAHGLDVGARLVLLEGAAVGVNVGASEPERCK